MTRVELLFEIIKVEAPLYEMALGSLTGVTPKRVGYIMARFVDMTTISLQEKIEVMDRPVNEMARELLDWIYVGADRPFWVPEVYEAS